jgi:hypothetical protein
MDNVQNCGSYINIPSLRTYRCKCELTLAVALNGLKRLSVEQNFEV